MKLWMLICIYVVMSLGLGLGLWRHLSDPVWMLGYWVTCLLAGYLLPMLFDHLGWLKL